MTDEGKAWQAGQGLTDKGTGQGKDDANHGIAAIGKGE